LTRKFVEQCRVAPWVAPAATVMASSKVAEVPLGTVWEAGLRETERPGSQVGTAVTVASRLVSPSRILLETSVAPTVPR
jgi:hypothetical protein